MSTRLSVAALVSALLAAPAVAADIFVGPGQSIQAAIVTANPGDRVLVQPGAYNEAIDFLGKAIEVIGLAGPAATTIDATGTGTSAVSFVSNEPSSAVLRGFEVTGGTGRLAGGAFGGGGIRVHGALAVVRECRVVNNSLSQSGSGAGVLATGPAPLGVITMVDCVVTQNQGRGVEGNLTLRRCTVSLNAGGIKGKRLDLSECLIADNVTTGNGGGLLAIAPESIAFDRCVFSGNQAGQDGGGMYLRIEDLPSVGLIENCWYVGNSAGGSGGALYVLRKSFIDLGSFLVVTKSMFANNRCGSGAGAGAYLTIDNITAAFKVITLDDCSFSGNAPSGLFADAPTVNVRRSVLWGQPNPISAPGGATVNVTQCDVQGGWPGFGNFNADPLFADAPSGDLHLLAGSPCIDAIPSIGPLTDFEGDERDAFYDVGADEFDPHLTIRGRPAASALVTIDITGPPGSPLLFFASLIRDEVGIPTPYGVFGLGFPLVPGFPISLGALSATGRLSLPVTLPPGVPPGVSIHSQVFFGTTVSNVESIRFE